MSKRTPREWSEVATSLPGAPECWDFTSLEHDHKVTPFCADGVGERPSGPHAISKDGAWWLPDEGRTRWILDVSHPATEGVLLRLAGSNDVLSILGDRGLVPPGKRKARYYDHLPIGVACIAIAEAMGRWPASCDTGCVNEENT